MSRYIVNRLYARLNIGAVSREAYLVSQGLHVGCVCKVELLDLKDIHRALSTFETLFFFLTIWSGDASKPLTDRRKLLYGG